MLLRHLVVLALVSLFCSSVYAKYDVVMTPNLKVQQVSEPGFGDVTNRYAFSMASFKDKLYVGTSNLSEPNETFFFGMGKPVRGNGTQIWQYNDVSKKWTKVVDGGLGTKSNLGVRNLKVVGGHLYGITVNHEVGMEVWRTSTGKNWEKVMTGGFGTADNTSGRGLESHNGYIYVTTENRVTGGQIWRNKIGSKKWEPVVLNGNGTRDNIWFSDFAVFRGHLYVGTLNHQKLAKKILEGGILPIVGAILGGESAMSEGMAVYKIIEKNNGQVQLKKIFDGGLTTTKHFAAMKLRVFNDSLFVSTMNWKDGASIFMSHDGKNFDEVLSNGGNSKDNAYFWNMFVYQNRLFAGTFHNPKPTSEVPQHLGTGIFSLFSTDNGVDWTLETDDAFASRHNQTNGDYGIRSFAVHHGKLYIGSATAHNSCKIYEAEMLDNEELEDMAI